MIIVYILTFFILVLFPGYWLVIRPWHLRWGTQHEERSGTLPGDDIVTQPRMSYTRAVSVKAPPEAIWPWLVQIGYQRAGWYSYDRLEQIAGAADFVDGPRSARRIVPELQDLSVGDEIRLAEEPAPAFEVAALEPPHALVLRGKPAPTIPDGTEISWVFVIQPHESGTTRLIARQRLGFPPRLANWIRWSVIELPNFIMEQKMLRGIKRRAERSAQ